MSALAAELLGLFAGFPMQAISEESAEARARHYLAAMSGFPIEAVRDAIGAWMRGDHARRFDNHAFPPSPPQLVRLARNALQPIVARIEWLETLARAEEVRPTPGADARARVAAMAGVFRRRTTDNADDGPAAE